MFFLAASFLQPVFANPAPPPQNQAPSRPMSSAVLPFLPSQLTLIKVKESSKDQVIQILGPPLKTDKNKNLFYTLGNTAFDTTIGFKEDKIHYILHSPAEGALILDEIKSKSPDLEFMPVKPPQLSHSSEHNFNLTSKDQSLTITVINNSQKSIETIVILR